MAVREKLLDFVTNVVVIYENTLDDYINRIEKNFEKEGRSAKSFMSILEIAKNAADVFEGGTKTLYVLVCDILLKVVYASGVRDNRNNVKKILDHLYSFKKNPEAVRKELVEAAYRIFCSFEWQFTQATANKTWQRAMTKLAEDAVGRAINYFKENKDVKFSADSVVCGVIFGESKSFKSYFHSGRTVQNKQLDDWNTGELFSKAGLTDGEKLYYNKIDGTSNTGKFGYRLPLQFEDKIHILDIYNKEQPCQPIYYTYVLQHDDTRDTIQQLLSCIDNDDYSLKKVEERIKKVVRERTEGMEEFLGDFNIFIDNNLNTLKEIINNNDEIKQDITSLKNDIHAISQQTKENITITKEVLIEVKRVSSQLDQTNKDKKTILWDVKQPKLILFSGRQKQLQDIDTKLEQKIIPVICGLGGVGKTELALEYVYTKYKNKQFSVINIDASTDKKAYQEFIDIHRKLKLERLADGEPKSDKIIVEEVYEYLGKNSLFIFDNAERYKAIKQFLLLAEPVEPFIIITSNNMQEWTSDRFKIKTVPLIGFEDAEAMAFVKDSLNLEDDAEDNDIKLLVKTLHNFPLTLNQAVACIKNENIRLQGHNREYKLTDYLRDYNENPRTFLEYEMDDSEKSIFKTLDVTIARIKQDNLYDQQALNLLNYISYFMPNDIPEIVFLNELAEGDDKKLLNITNLLEKYAILNLNAGKLNVHGLVQQAVRLELKANKKVREYLEKILHLLKEKLNNREDVETYSNHIITVWKHAHVHKDLIDTFIMDNDENAYTTYFHLIAEGDSYDTVKAVLEEIKTSYSEELPNLITQRDKERGIALHNASSSGNAEIVKLLIDQGAKVTAKKKHEWRPLHLACKNGHLEVVEVLLKNGASVDNKTGYKFTPLHLASRNGWPDIIQVLLKHGAKINDTTRYGETPLHVAVKANKLECVEELLENVEINVNAETDFKWTPLHFATKEGFTNIVKVLLSNSKIEINVRNRNAFTPLHFASLYNYLEIVQEFLAIESIDINAQTSKGNTPLHVASERGNVEVVKTLLTNSAKTDITNGDGKTAKDLAANQTVVDIFPTS